MEQRVWISFRHEVMKGIVTATFEQQDGRRRFAVRWDAENGKMEQGREQPFVADNGMVVACHMISEPDAIPV